MRIWRGRARHCHRVNPLFLTQNLWIFVPYSPPDFTENLVLIGKEIRQHINRLISPTNQCAVMKSMPGYKLANALL